MNRRTAFREQETLAEPRSLVTPGFSDLVLIPVSFYFCLGQYNTAWGVRPAICDGGGEHQAAELGCSC